MKRLLLVFLVGVIFLLPLKVEAAEYYTVQKGDCLSVIGQKLGMDWREIAQRNNIQPPDYLIYPEQKLVLDGVKPPESVQWQPYTQVGANPYRNTWQWALKNFDLPEQIREKIRQNIQQDKFEWFELASGQKIVQMVSGKNQILNQLICQWDPIHLYAAKDYGVDGYHYLLILKCGNWAWWKKEKAVKEVPPVPVSKSIEREKQLPPVPVFESARDQKKSFQDEFDLYVGGGIYDSVHFDHTDGRYGWSKLRWRPINLKLSESIDLGLGAFGFGALGSGSDGDYDYQWRQWNLGLTAKLIGKSWDADFDFGFLGRLKNEGSIELYQSEQIDDLGFRYFSAHLNLYGRRDRGESWFPKTELNFEGRWPSNRTHVHSWDENALGPDPYDNRNIELMLTQGIYDFELSNELMLTPGFNLGVGRAFGLEQNYYQFGPRIALAWYNRDIVSFSFLNYKEMLGGDGDQWHWISGWISVGDLISAYQASRITKATAKDFME